jgi:hypothetical protein
MDITLFKPDYENRRGLDDRHCGSALYRQNDANHALVKLHNPRLVKVLVT